MDVRLFLCGDVMPGRGVDQILPHPGDPELRERGLLDARDYVAAAESRNGPITRPVEFAWPWGEALRVLDAARPDARVINLESSITRCDHFAPGKGVHYRMSPDNVRTLTAGRPDVCCLANNHVLDFGRRGLADTLDALAGAGLRWVGAGRDAAEAARPVVVGAGARIAVFAWGAASSGIPRGWAAEPDRSGVNFLPDLSDRTADDVLDAVHAHTAPGDVVVVSLHWGTNWCYEVDADQVRFAHRLVDGGVDVVHGHSSHHPRPVEIHRDRLVLYGCGDFIDDYEGIRGYEEFRDDLRLLFLATLRADGALRELRMVPVQARRMRLAPASDADTRWLHDTLSRISAPFRTEVALDDGTLSIGHRT
ncbi:CapA family protein [Saccharopolyspora rosea]|uniref:CapA family protein n=1 Tax=Saccharopolyspora rosea TaxID=524884 RepID=A0ABW3FWC5_9PSEU|nr:CapA family protein [Saccharopolyspora rosea]